MVPEDENEGGDIGSHDLAHDGAAAAADGKPSRDESTKKQKRRAKEVKEKEELSEEESDDLSPVEEVPAHRSAVGPKKTVC